MTEEPRADFPLRVEGSALVGGDGDVRDVLAAARDDESAPQVLRGFGSGASGLARDALDADRFTRTVDRSVGENHRTDPVCVFMRGVPSVVVDRDVECRHRQLAEPENMRVVAFAHDEPDGFLPARQRDFALGIRRARGNRLEFFVQQCGRGTLHRLAGCHGKDGCEQAVIGSFPEHAEVGELDQRLCGRMPARNAFDRFAGDREKDDAGLVAAEDFRPIERGHLLGVAAGVRHLHSFAGKRAAGDRIRRQRLIGFVRLVGLEFRAVVFREGRDRAGGILRIDQAGGDPDRTEVCRLNIKNPASAEDLVAGDLGQVKPRGDRCEAEFHRAVAAERNAAARDHAVADVEFVFFADLEIPADHTVFPPRLEAEVFDRRRDAEKISGCPRGDIRREFLGEREFERAPGIDKVGGVGGLQAQRGHVAQRELIRGPDDMLSVERAESGRHFQFPALTDRQRLHGGHGEAAFDFDRLGIRIVRQWRRRPDRLAPALFPVLLAGLAAADIACGCPIRYVRREGRARGVAETKKLRVGQNAQVEKENHRSLWKHLAVGHQDFFRARHLERRGGHLRAESLARRISIKGFQARPRADRELHAERRRFAWHENPAPRAQPGERARPCRIEHDRRGCFRRPERVRTDHRPGKSELQRAARLKHFPAAHQLDLRLLVGAAGGEQQDEKSEQA